MSSSILVRCIVQIKKNKMILSIKTDKILEKDFDFSYKKIIFSKKTNL